MSGLTPEQRAISGRMAIRIMARGHRVYIVAIVAVLCTLLVPLEVHPLMGGLLLGTIVALGQIWCGIYLGCEIMAVASSAMVTFAKVIVASKENGNDK